MQPRPRLASSVCFALAALLLVLSACAPSQSAESPENPPAKADGDKAAPKDADAKPVDPDAPATPDATPSTSGTSGTPGTPGTPAGKDVPKGMSMDTYEMTPSDCDALGRHYGEVARSDQLKDLSPKLSEKQRSATAAQIDRVVGKIEDNWTSGCRNALVDKAVDHDAIKCALVAKTVHDFDVCLNGEKGTPQSTGKPKKK